jgi:two-component system response regulator GlrR
MTAIIDDASVDSAPAPTLESAAKVRKAPQQRKDLKPNQVRILVVDGDVASRRLMCVRLSSADYLVDSVADGGAALDACVRRRPNLVITDLRVGALDGLGFLRELKSRWPDIIVIVVTAHDSIPEAVLATERGAFSYLVQPVEKGELLGHVERAIVDSTFTASTEDWRADIVTRNQLLQYRLQEINWAAGSDVPILITGQNDTGKELMARAIHAGSARRCSPFVAVHCAERSEQWLEHRLFGSDPASSNEFVQPAGVVYTARGGTLLLGEIGRLPPRLQERLAGALRHHSVHFDRDDSQIAVDLRLICTTSRDLRPLLAAGTFSESLFNQINILPIEIPPLGRRREDIPLLISHFLEQATERRGIARIYSASEIAKLATHTWPKHVQRLFELVKKDVELTHDCLIPEPFPQPAMNRDVVQDRACIQARDRLEYDRRQLQLEKQRGAQTLSARIIKRNRNEFYKLLGRMRRTAPGADQSSLDSS